VILQTGFLRGGIGQDDRGDISTSLLPIPTRNFVGLQTSLPTLISNPQGLRRVSQSWSVTAGTRLIETTSSSPASSEINADEWTHGWKAGAGVGTAIVDQY